MVVSEILLQSLLPVYDFYRKNLEESGSSEDKLSISRDKMGCLQGQATDNAQQNLWLIYILCKLYTILKSI